MNELDFALWSAVGGYSALEERPADAYERYISLAQQIEQLGWHSFFVIEHQNSPAVGRITSPTVFLTAVARATSKLRIGAMMWQLPFYHPLRLAQDVAMLDHLSHGRVEFGTGIGVHEHEFMRWNVDFYKRAAIAGEVLDIVKMAWTQEQVTFEGKYFKFNEALPQPQPYQKPIPIWAAVHSDAAIDFAAKNNYHVAQNLDTDEVIARKFNLFWKIWHECKHAGPKPRVFLQRQVHVAETDEKAHEEARQFLVAREGGAVPVGGGPIEKTKIGWGTHPRGMGKDSDRPDDKARGETIFRSATDYQFNIDAGLAIVGSPDTVIKKLQAGQEMIGYDLFCTNHEIGRMPDEMVNNSIRLFGKYVIPAFRPVQRQPSAKVA